MMACSPWFMFSENMHYRELAELVPTGAEALAISNT
jgi:hypothetical protein